LRAAKRDSRAIFVRYGVRYKPQNVRYSVRYGENASRLEQMRTINSNLFQTHILQRENSRTFEKSLPWRAS
jgi:hypothetical protein